MHHVVMFSGGAASYVAAKRVIEKYGKENVTLLFADTRTEDETLYEFVAQAEIVAVFVSKLANPISRIC